MEGKNRQTSRGISACDAAGDAQASPLRAVLVFPTSHRTVSSSSEGVQHRPAPMGSDRVPEGFRRPHEEVPWDTMPSKNSERKKKVQM